ncbi:MAG: hypothetical protein LBC64_06630 [Fibromonadaceae bacterium]|jgi:hypothetical protein|nr:hypothetical protein [Fibromonadaceae bacterium]
MKKQFTKLALSAALVLASLFTISCGEHSWETIEEWLKGSSSSEEGGYSSNSSYPQVNDGGGSLLRQAVNVGYNIRNAADYAGNWYLRYHAVIPPVSTFVNEDGTITVCVLDDNAKIAHIYEFSMTLELQGTFNFPYEFDMFGAFTKDKEGNYYFFYGKEAADVRQGEDAENEPENMAMVKYDRSGNKIKTYKRKPRSYRGVRVPFVAGNCVLEISGSSIAVYFSRLMFRGADNISHQASYGFILNKDTFEQVPSSSPPYISHSVNQFILPINDGFVFADHGDALPRAFNFEKCSYEEFYNHEGYYCTREQSWKSFRFAGNDGANVTNAQMGGLAKTSSGYIFAGTYGESPDKRNLLILTLDDYEQISNPLYLTTYAASDNRSVGHPKIVGIGSGQYLLLWELYELPSTGGSKYLTTKMQIINEAGNPLSPAKDLQGLRLNIGDFLHYNSRNGRVYWAINNMSELVVYGLDARYAYDSDDFTLP